jgi:putative NIF3 family GTP cyclohydrolase 1 type 2
MSVSRLSRRDFVRLGAAGVAGTSLAFPPGAVHAAALTAQDIIDRIRKNLGLDWNSSTIDTFKAGDPATVVSGVVTTSLATLDVMRRAVKSGANLIVTSGPTFYSRTDSPMPPAGRGRGATPPPSTSDPVFTAKNEFIRTNKLVVWRFSEHWRRQTPDPFVVGMIDALGWTKYGSGGNPRRVTIPALTLDALAADAKAKLGARGGIRVVGDPQARVQTIGLAPGTIAIQETLAILPQVDVMIAGEIREWESSEYARDLVTAGRNTALILVGRSLSEDAGMKVCAEWLATIASDVPVHWLPAGDPYWSPAA